MPSRAPSYYHWSQDHPCTTNETYGYHLKEYLTQNENKPKKKIGPFDYNRPFSNSGFFPRIDHTGSSSSRRDSSDKERPTMALNRYNINQGYVMGRSAVKDRLVHSSLPVGVMTTKGDRATPGYTWQAPRGKDIFLWHTLAGTLVHAKHYQPDKHKDTYTQVCY